MDAVRPRYSVSRKRGDGQVLDRGVVGWYRILELTGDLPDVYRVGEKVRCPTGIYRIKKLARVAPEHGGVTVCAEIASR